MRINGDAYDLRPHCVKLIVLGLELRQLTASTSGEVEQIKGEHNRFMTPEQVRQGDLLAGLAGQLELRGGHAYFNHATRVTGLKRASRRLRTQNNRSQWDSRALPRLQGDGHCLSGPY